MSTSHLIFHKHEETFFYCFEKNYFGNFLICENVLKT